MLILRIRLCNTKIRQEGLKGPGLSSERPSKRLIADPQQNLNEPLYYLIPRAAPEGLSWAEGEEGSLKKLLIKAFCLRTPLMKR